MRDLSELPDGWRLLRLEDVAEVNPRRPTLNIPIDIPTTFVPMAAVGENCRGVIAHQSRPYGEISKGYTYFENNDVLFAKITPCLQNGKHALVSSLKGGFGFGTTEFHTVRAGDRLEPRLLYRTLTQPQNILKCISSFAGTAGQQRVQPDVLRSLWLMLPPLAEQRAISDVLDAIDEAIERTEAVISATERLRDALLHKLLTRGVPGWHTQWRHVPGLGIVPTDWQVVRLEDVANIQTGRAVNRKATQIGRLEVPYLSVANVKDGYLDLGFVKTMQVSAPELCRYRLRNGDVLFTEGGDADKLGRGTVWRGEIDPCLHQNHVFAVRPHESRLTPEFLAAYAASSAGKRYFLGAAKQTTNLASVNSTQLKRMLLPLPNLEEQGRITEILAAAQKANSAVSTSRDRLRATKTAAADALLSGRMRAIALRRWCNES